MHLFLYDSYIDEINDPDFLLDSFYGYYLYPFFNDGLFDLKINENSCHIVMTENCPYLTFFMKGKYIKIPYHPNYNFSIYFYLFSLLYACTIPEKIRYDYEYIYMIGNLFNIISTSLYIIKDSEICEGSLIELLESNVVFHDEYKFNIVNLAG